jgi:hypothetical protein
LLLDEQVDGFGTSVANNYTLGENGPTLEMLAAEHGLWNEPESGADVLGEVLAGEGGASGD